MKAEILTLLCKQEDYISGQQLCEHLGVSRTAIWKVMKRLKEEGYEIDSVSNKGYRLISQPDVLTKEAILSKLQTKYMGQNLVCLKETTSTNTIAKQMAEEKAEEGTLVVANHQTVGKGRRGRVWSSPKNTGIFMTVILKPRIRPEFASMLTIVAAKVLNDVIREVSGLPCMIKWPNDIVVNGKKICGILTELSAEVDYINYIVVGIGINVSMMSFPEELKDKATSILLETGKNSNRAELVAKTMHCFERYYEEFIQTNTLQPLEEEYNKVLINMNKEVKVLSGEESYTGIARGITDKGHLLVEKENHKVEEVYAGEVSVRGLYSYTD